MKMKFTLVVALALFAVVGWCATPISGLPSVPNTRPNDRLMLDADLSGAFHTRQITVGNFLSGISGGGGTSNYYYFTNSYNTTNVYYFTNTVLVTNDYFVTNTYAGTNIVTTNYYYATNTYAITNDYFVTNIYAGTNISITNDFYVTNSYALTNDYYVTNSYATTNYYYATNSYAVTNTYTITNQSLSVSTLTYTTNQVIDLSTNDYKLLTLESNANFTAVNMVPAVSVVVRMHATNEARNLYFPAGWVWLGTMPTNLAANKVGVLSLTAFGTDETNVISAWGAQP